MKNTTIYYMNSEGLVCSGKLIKEENGPYFGHFLLIKNKETKELESIFPSNILSKEMFKLKEGKRINRGRRWKKQVKK